jgi:hypothetical protein
MRLPFGTQDGEQDVVMKATATELGVAYRVYEHTFAGHQPKITRYAGLIPARVDLTVSPWSDDQCARLWLALIGRQAKIDRRSDSRDDIPESINYNN